VLLMAEKWNTPPWNITPGKSQIWWFAHWQFFEQMRATAQRTPTEWQS
jgi:hypothetical protein